MEKRKSAITVFFCIMLMGLLIFDGNEIGMKEKESEYCYADFYLRENFFNYLNMDINNFRDVVRICKRIGSSKSGDSADIKSVKTLSEFCNRYIGTYYAYRNYVYAKKQENLSDIPETFLQNYFELLSSLSAFYNIISCASDEKIKDISNTIMEQEIIDLTLKATIDYSDCSLSELNNDTTLKYLAAEIDKINVKFSELN